MSNEVTQRFIVCHYKLKELGKIRSSRQFAMALGYLPQSLSEMLKGRRDVTIDLLEKSVEVYKFNPVYLFTGAGSMFIDGEDKNGMTILTVVVDEDNNEKIVHVPIPAQAGYPSEFDNPDFIQDLPSFSLPDYKYKIGTHRSFDVAGDSMEPTLFEGDKVICSYVEPNLWEIAIKNNYVYIIVTKSDILVKRVHNLLKVENELLLISDNNYYDPFRVSLSDICELWYVRAKISPFLPSPQNINNSLLKDMNELRQTIQHQSTLIENLNKVIEALAKKQN